MSRIESPERTTRQVRTASSARRPTDGLFARLAVGEGSRKHVSMCGRYASFLPAEAVARLFHTTNAPPNVAPSWNVAPTQNAMVVRRHPETGERHVDLLKWGLLTSWTKDPAKTQRPINARAETVATSGVFRGAFKARRCIVPADAFYEWMPVEGGKQPYAIARQDGQPMAFAGRTT